MNQNHIKGFPIQPNVKSAVFYCNPTHIHGKFRTYNTEARNRQRYSFNLCRMEFTLADIEIYICILCYFSTPIILLDPIVNTM